VKRARRISQRQLAVVASSLAAVDKAVLGSLEWVRLASGSQLLRLHFAERPSAERQARRHLARLVELRLLARLTRRIGGVRAGSSGFVYALDVAGQRLLAAGSNNHRHPWTPGVPFLAHALAVTEIYVKLIEAERRGLVEVLGFAAEPRCWRSFTGAGGVPATLKPDAFLRLGLGDYEDSWFIEVDRATEAPSTLARKLDLYRRYWQSGREQSRHGVFPRVLWIVPNEQRKGLVVELTATQPAEAWSLFQVVTDEQALAPLTGSQP
jgi:hypothetical protein